jgi:predicted ATP-dependent protease
VQPIGGVNEKIEGFYDICKARGLSGEQGVMIPKANVQHLMLREDVVEAVRQGKFNVYAVSHVDEGIEILTGIKAGKRGADGKFEPGTINAQVEEKLNAFAERARAFGRQDGRNSGNGSSMS